MYDVTFYNKIAIKLANQSVQVGVHFLNFFNITALTQVSLELKILDDLLQFQAHDVQQTASLHLT